VAEVQVDGENPMSARRRVLSVPSSPLKEPPVELRGASVREPSGPQLDGEVQRAALASLNSSVSQL